MFCLISYSHIAQTSTQPIRLGVAGLTHDHVNWILSRGEQEDVMMVGIAEPNKALAQRYAERYGFSMELVFNSLEEMIKATQPQAVAAFGSIFNHLEVVEVCAPLGIHVMVEKPLAVSVAHAQKMADLAKKHDIHLITNYETTWYATNHRAYQMINDHQIGDLRKIVVRDGHKGPKEIGVTEEFLSWLTDPVTNGGGAIIDFGCYGANLITWLTKGIRPDAITAITQTIKPDIYPKVDDEATILLKYPAMQGIIEASWNWPIGRKDMELYGQTGYIYSDNSRDLRFRLSENEAAQKITLEDRPVPYNDPFAFFAALIKGEINMPAYDLSSLENNLLVVEILEAAKKSAQTGKTFKLSN